MNSQLAIVVLIDVEAARKAKSLQGNTYLIDNNRFMGSTGEGSEQLCTTIVGNQIMNWLASGIDVSGQQPFPVLVGIGGEAVDKQIMVPQLFDSPALDGSLGLWWGATVDANVAGKYSYTLYFDIAGERMEFVSSIDVRTGFTMGTAFSFKAAAANAGVRTAATSLRARTTADGSLANPDNHVSLFTRHQVDAMKSLRGKLQP